jgi:hypothetical protein
MIDILSDNWIIAVCFLVGVLLGLFAGKFYKKKNVKMRLDEADMISVQNWDDVVITE